MEMGRTSIMLQVEDRNYRNRVKWKVTKAWAETQPKKFWGSTHDIRHDLCRQMSTIPQMSVLSIGCGIGIIESFVPHNCALIGMDIDLEALRYAQEYNPWCLFMLGDGQRLPFKDSSMDSVILASVIEYIPPEKREAFVQEIWRVLTDRGVGILTTPNREHPLYNDSVNKLSLKELWNLFISFKRTHLKFFSERTGEPIDEWIMLQIRKVGG